MHLMLDNNSCRQVIGIKAALSPSLFCETSSITSSMSSRRGCLKWLICIHFLHAKVSLISTSYTYVHVTITVSWPLTKLAQTIYTHSCTHMQAHKLRHTHNIMHTLYNINYNIICFNSCGNFLPIGSGCVGCRLLKE